jgi:hypothetical protein
MQVIGPLAFQHEKALRVYHDYLKCKNSHELGAFDENAAGPILSFAYVQSVGLKLVALTLHYTKLAEGEEKGKKWPIYWKKTGFPSIWGFSRVNVVESHTAAVERFGKTAPAGTRHLSTCFSL